MVKLINAYTLSECLDVMTENVAAYEGLKRRNLIFCEDRLTLVAERALLRKTGGTFLSEVTTFARFLKTDGKVLSKQGSVMAVGEIIGRLQKQGKLRSFTRGGYGVGGAKCIYEQVAQFISSELTPQSLADSVAALKDDALKNKMLDLSLIYAEYDAFLKSNGYLDEGNYLTLLPDAIRGETGIEYTNVFFLCYSSFTAQAVKTIAAAIECAANVVGIFFNGEEEIYTGSAHRRFLDAAKEEKKLFSLNAGTPLDGEAEVLRVGLFQPLVGGEKVKTDKIRIYAAASVAEETEFVATQIRKRMMEDDTLKYGDFSVLVADTGGYSLAVKKAFSEYSIPYSTDERIALSRHPLAKFLLALLESAESRYLPSAVDSVLANIFFGEGDEYRNYLLKYGNSRGGALKEIRADAKGYDVEGLRKNRERLLSLVGNFKRRAKGSEYAAAIRKILSDEEMIKTLTALETEEKDATVKSYLSQILPTVKALLDEVELLTGGEEMAIKDFAALLKDGLGATEIAPNPLKVDAVFVGDITDSRIERTRVLFAVGLTDGVPKTSSDANLVTDRDKEKLGEVKAAIEPMVTEVNLRNRESAALNLCTFTDALYLTYPVGKGEVGVSELVYYVKELFVGLDGNPLPVEKEISGEDLSYLCSAPVPAVRKLLVDMDDYQSGKSAQRKEYSTLLAALEERGILTGEDVVKTDKSFAPLSSQLLFVGGTLSPTKIEGYFTCPYRNFLASGLGLKEREETTVLATDTGTFIHALLEKTTGRTKDFDSEEGFAAFAKTVGEELLKAPLFAALKETAAGAYSTDSLLNEGVTVARAVYRQLEQSSYQVEELEKSVSTPHFHGKIDRVDVSDNYVRIIDYKTSSVDDSPTSYYVGKKMQLQLYMSAVIGERIPAGVFYFPASVSYSDSEEGKFRMAGFFNSDEEAIRRGDKSISEEKKSEFFDAQLGKKGVEKSMDGETFGYFLDYATLLSEKAREEVKSGYIEPTPYGSVCSYCQFGGACGFCRGEKSEPRSEKAIKADEIAKIVKRKKEEENDG